jgi:aryl-alcohol dehydrogenase-like predicted oxidoreductase
MMQKIELGRSGIFVPPVIFGCNVFGWTLDKAQSFRVLDELVELGLNALDTADVYAYWVPGNKGGESETIMGEWLKARGRRHDVLILSKAGMEMPGIGKGLSPAYLASAIEASLKRLGTDVIDLYQSHRDDESVPQEETLAAFDKMIKAGKVQLRKVLSDLSTAETALNGRFNDDILLLRVL